jgi:hypothetical protein
MTYLLAGAAISALAITVLLLRKKLPGQSISAQIRHNTRHNSDNNTYHNTGHNTDHNTDTHYTVRIIEPGSDPMRDRVELHFRTRDER